MLNKIKRNKVKKLFGLLAVSALLASSLTSCNTAETSFGASTVQAAQVNPPKYVFLFVGDGLSYPQIQSASYYIGAAASNGDVVSKPLSFTDFPVTGSAETFDRTSFAPDSASTATSIATGNKTYSGVINYDTTFTTKFETITEKLKAQKNYKIGVISSVNLNHATPAAFYAHQESRGNYYEIGLELIDSGFDYFAGGALLSPTGKEDNQPDFYELAESADYKIARTKAEAENLTSSDGKAIIISEVLADSSAMPYEMDADSSQLLLKDYVAKGIELLDNDTGFFMMVEGGKIDWACHANDAAATINDTIALSNAVAEAVKFYKQHPKETLILVTGDHETGGLTIGFAGTDYDTYLTNLTNQKISYAKFDSDYVAGYRENKTPFTQVLTDIEKCFGLLAPDEANDSKLVLTDYELSLLESAYQRTLETGSSSKGNMSQEEYLLYGTYQPLTVTITHLLNNKSGIAFTSYAHTGLPVPVYAMGQGSDNFAGHYDNTDIYKNMASILGVK